ncbi:Cof-type HAD-IIB family hydrolase [Floccifex sp.]|uniref:Cof-type HAD-IIB family hydrolase n=1 Tax=Floccifex sp. TaxID=2815810 RepID=UPI003F0DDEFF
MKNAYFFDMDGTLYHRKYHDVSSKTCEILKELQKKGHIVGLSTSRCFQELSCLPSCIRTFPFDFKILDGGSLILDARNQILYHFPIPVSKMKEIDRYCQENEIVYRYSTKDGNYWGRMPKMKDHKIWMDLYLCTPEYKEYQDDEVLNLLIMSNEESVKAYISNLFSNKGMVQYPDCLEIRNDGLNKAKAIELVCQQEKIDHLICFGDGENDMEMIQIADTGIAMGNAIPVLKEIADIVIGNIETDPIYHYLTQGGN